MVSYPDDGYIKGKLSIVLQVLAELKRVLLASISSINLVSIFRCSSSAHNRVHVRRVDSSQL